MKVKVSLVETTTLNSKAHECFSLLAHVVNIAVATKSAICFFGTVLRYFEYLVHRLLINMLNK